MSKKKDSNLKCSVCKKAIDFYFHECKRAYQEYIGCKFCDDWCDSCKKKRG
jgi:hypothetical protein